MATQTCPRCGSQVIPIVSAASLHEVIFQCSECGAHSPQQHWLQPAGFSTNDAKLKRQNGKSG